MHDRPKVISRRTQGFRARAAWVVALYPVLCLLPLGMSVFRQVAPAGPLELAAAALGLVALVAMAVQFVTSGRFMIISGRMGIDKIMAFHKIAAWWVLLGLLFHPLLYVYPTWSADALHGRQLLIAYLTLPHYRTGVVALAALALLVGSSVLRHHLPWRYEVWRASHITLALLAFGGGLHHAVTVGRFSALGAVHLYWWAVGAGVAMVVGTLYGWRWLRLHRRPWRLNSVKKRADRMWELDIQPAPSTPPLAYEAGQFVWMTVGARRFPLFDHPFSIADSPRRPGLSLIIKEAGDFTNRVGSLSPGTMIGIDGPYGDFTLETHDGDSILLFAGGVGIGPIMGLLRDLVARQDLRPIRLAYAVGKTDNFACLAEIEAARDSIDLQVMLLSEEAEPGWTGVVGRLDTGRLTDLLAGLDPSRSLALICGPGPMITAVLDVLIEIGMPLDRVLYERFDYSGGTSRQDRRRLRHIIAMGALLGLGVLIFPFLAS